MKEQNFQIENIGLYYIAHFNCCMVRLWAEDFSFDIPLDRVNEFCYLFPDINWENGAFLEVLKNRYMRALIDNGKVVGLKHITLNRTYLKDVSNDSEV